MKKHCNPPDHGAQGLGVVPDKNNLKKKYPHAKHKHDANEAHQAIVCEKQVV